MNELVYIAFRWGVLAGFLIALGVLAVRMLAVTYFKEKEKHLKRVLGLCNEEGVNKQ